MNDKSDIKRKENEFVIIESISILIEAKILRFFPLLGIYTNEEIENVLCSRITILVINMLK